LRNLTFRNPDTEKFLAEILRVLKPGGTFVAVESSQPKSKIFRTVFHMYMKYFVTWLGAIISGNKGAYQYFTFSVRNFYSADDLVKLFTGQGFATAEYIPLFGGVSAIHIARKPDK
jgi:demethylmenaquinone methyltransferase/2-methoxy-6-polyprenyl-1,4-benzoquinol methylase